MEKERLELDLSLIELNEGQLSWLPKNPRTWTQTDIDKTAASIKQDPDFLEDRPLLVVSREDSPNLVVFAGNLRSVGARAARLSRVPCVLYSPEEDEDYETIRRRAMKDNGSFGSWDFDALANEWDDLPLTDWGVPAWETECVEDAGASEGIEENECEVNEDEVQTRCASGQVWQLGRHRLMCGDSTKIEDIQKLTGGVMIDLCLTDPPYGIDIVRHTGTIGGGGIMPVTVYHKIKGDDTTETARLSYDIMKDISKNQIIFGGNYFTEFLPPKACWVVWNKMNGETFFADVELAWTSYDKGAQLYQWLWNGMARAGDRKTEGEKRMHPTQKPVGLFAKIIEDFSKEQEKILDLFAGSGPLALAAEQTNRIAYMMEFEPFYCDMIIARWEKYTGQTAKLVED